jgi:integrase
VKVRGFMSVLAECPVCHRKQATKNKHCGCGNDMDKSKRSKKVRYWISYRLPGGKQRRELVGKSIEKARDADGKRRGQKRENRIFDMLPASDMTFTELSDWYLKLSSVTKLASYDRINIAMNKFNSVFGDRIVNTILPVDLEDYQEKRIDDGLALSTMDVEMAIIKIMINKAFDNDKVDGRVLKTFRKVKNKLKRGANARKRTGAIEEYLRLLAKASSHLRPMLIMAMNTGMRPGEVRTLRWAYIDQKSGFIRLPASSTKESKEKIIPINSHVKTVLDDLVPSLGVVTKDHHDFIFTFGGKPIKGLGGVKGALKNACKNAGVPYGRKLPEGIIMHDFRRTVKTNMQAAGVSRVCRDLILGHSLQGMDPHYIVPSEETLRQAMDKYTRWLDDQIAKALASVDQNVDQAGI